MSMTRNFKSAKLQLTLTNPDHPKGVKHFFNNVRDEISDEEVTRFNTAIEMLTAEKAIDTDIIITSQIVASK